MSRRIDPQIEPLSRAAWERVEAGLFERLERGEHRRPSVAPAPVRSYTPLWAGMALAAAATLLLWLWPAREQVLAPTAASAPVLDVAAGAAAREEARIATTDAPTRTTLSSAALTLAAHSEVHVAGSDASGWLVRLAQGQVDCEVAPRQGRPPFVVQAGDTRVTVVGTRFTVIRSELGASVRVQEGRVKVANGKEEVLLGPGESWPSAPLTVAALPEAEPELAEAPPPRATKLNTKQRRPKATRAAAPSEAERFARAARLEATDPRHAAAIYRQLSASGGAWAANALYAEARLELERGRRQRAAQLLRRYLARHPDGSNAADVAALLQRLGAEPR